MVNRRWKVIVCTFWFLWFLIFGAVQLPGFTLAYLVFIDVFLLCVCVSFVMLLVMAAVGRLRSRRSTRYLRNTQSSLQGCAVWATCI